MQVEFSAIVQALADDSETELTSEQIWDVFERTYLMPVREQAGFIYRAHRLSEHADGQGIELDLIGADGASAHFQGVETARLLRRWRHWDCLCVSTVMKSVAWERGQMPWR